MGEEGAHALDGGDEGRVRGDVDCLGRGGGGGGDGDGGVEEGAFGYVGAWEVVLAGREEELGMG